MQTLTSAPILPWVVNEIDTSGTWLHVAGFNIWQDRQFSWSITTWSFEDPSFFAARYDLRDASITDAGLELLRILVSDWTDAQRAAVAGLIDLVGCGVPVPFDWKVDLHGHG